MANSSPGTTAQHLSPIASVPAMSENDRLAHEESSYVRTPRVAAVGVIGRTRGRTVTTVRTPDGITGTVTAVAR